MLAEKKMNWHLSGSGERREEKLSLDGIDKKRKEYQNASRSIIRLTWFLDFVYEMVAYMRANETVCIYHDPFRALTHRKPFPQQSNMHITRFWPIDTVW